MTDDEREANYAGVGVDDIDTDTAPEPDESEPDYDYVRQEGTASYRDQMRDAGRGHLVRW